jgi:ABC-type uncharacterized transport system permease subunit
MHTVTDGQIVLVLLAATLFGIGGILSVFRTWMKVEGVRPWLGLCLFGGIGLAVAAIIWHAQTRQQWLPINDNFDALVWLAVLLAMFVSYVQWHKPLPGLEWFIMPVAILLLISAAVFGRLVPHDYQTIGKDTWLWVHSATAYGGAAVFAVAAATGGLYVMASRLLRRKKGPPLRLASLERLEHIMMVSVTLGFALLTIGSITGFIRMFEHTQKPAHVKLLLAMLAWVVYAVVMHAPINPRFRGRRAAMLSIFGFVLMIGSLIAVQFMPGGNG